MRFRISPDVACQLELGGRSVRLETEELSELSTLLGRTGHAAGRELLQRLFSLGIVEPEAGGLETTSASRWTSRLQSAWLSPWLSIEVRVVARGTRVPRGEEAAGLFLEPAVVAAASDLSSRLSGSLKMATTAAAIRGQKMSRPLVQVLLEDILRSWSASLEPSLPIGLVNVDDNLLVELPPSLTSTSGERVGAWETELTLVHRHARRTVRLPVKDLGAVAAVLEATARRCAPSEDMIFPAVMRVLAAIEDLNGWTEGPGPDHAYRKMTTETEELAVTHMGHAGLIVDSACTRLLVDPWLFPWSGDNFVQPLSPDQLGAVDAICFTHHHPDHLDLASLLLLPHHVPVIIAEEGDTPFAPRVSKLLEIFGFSEVRTLEAGQITEVGDLEVEAVPFTGEGKNHLGFAATCFCISSEDSRVLVHADASPDSDGNSLARNGALDNLVRRRGTIDVVFGSWWQERTFRCQLSPFAPLLPTIPPADWLIDNEQCDCSLEHLHDVMIQSGARLFVTYAESGEELFLPDRARSAYVPTVSLLWRSWDDMASKLQENTGTNVVAAKPYMVVGISPDHPPTVRRAPDRSIGIAGDDLCDE